MSLASTLRPVGLSFNTPPSGSTPDLAAVDVPFHHEPNYLQLQRMLSRYQNLILLIPSSDSHSLTSTYDITPLQRQIQAELYCPLPFHRTKWLHSIESARNLLLTLERQAQSIKSPRAKKDALRDLAEKKQIIKRLRSRVEEIGREVESLGSDAWDTRKQGDEELLGERTDVVLAKMGKGLGATAKNNKPDGILQEGKPVTQVSEETQKVGPDASSDRDALLDSSIRRRYGQGKETPIMSPADKGTTSGFSNLAQTEKSLQTHTREHEDLTSALVSMAAQLKQQSRAFQFSLTQDENFLNRAVEGLDLNLTRMEAASKNMAFLRRMSEEQGWFGRLKLYGIILGLWVVAFLLVFVGPKLRF